MKKAIALNALAAAGLMASAAVWADTNTLTVQASVTGTCKFNSAASTLPFPALDPSVGTDVNATQALLTYWCTKGQVASTSASNGANPSGTQRRMKGPGATDFIPYSLTLAGGAQTGQGKSTNLNLTLDGIVLGTDYINATAGVYSDTVTLTITP